MERKIVPELLDQLPAEDAGAMRSRRDLQRLNALMRNATTMARALHVGLGRQAPQRLVELGAGDGTFFLRVARQLDPAWKGVTAICLDRHNLVTSHTRQAFARLTWKIASCRADVFTWLHRAPALLGDAVFTNLFLHHFSSAQVAEVLREAQQRTRLFIAVEPHRSVGALAFSRCVRLIGCGKITRHDAPASVRAGFAGCELSQLWPSDQHWILWEGRAGLFSHLFMARKRA